MNITHLKRLHSDSLKWRHWVLIALLAIVTATRLSPALGTFYTTHVYPVIGRVISPVSGFVPFAIGDIFIFLSIAWAILYPAMKRTKDAVWRVAEYLLWIYAWFYMAWGLNYSQPNIYQRINMKPVEVSKTRFKTFAYQYADSLNKLSEECRVKSEECRVKSEGCRVKSEESKLLRKKGNYYEEKVKCEESILKGYYRIGGCGINAPFNHHPHVKTMVFSWLSSMAGITGSMGPFFCEFTLNSDLRHHEYPATYAHEFAHFLGVANEGEANFYSYIVCTASSDMAVRFSGYYQIFFHVVNDVFDILGQKEGAVFLKHIRPEIIKLAKSDRRYWLSKRSKVINAAQDIILDLYLRGNNVAEGRKSYSQVIALILAWEDKKAHLTHSYREHNTHPEN